jgi:hypothetical protein
MVSKKRASPGGAVGAAPTTERAVKCCLAKTLRLPGARAILEQYVCNTSKLLHRGSLALSHYLLRKLAAGEDVSSGALDDQMLYYTAFTLGDGDTHGMKYPGLRSYFNASAAEFHERSTARLPYDGSLINAAARQFGTNVKTALGGTFKIQYDIRLTRVANLVIPHYRSRFSAALCAHIFARPPGRRGAEGPLDEAHWEFIGKVRGFLDVADGESIPPWWGEIHQAEALRFRYKLLKYHGEAEISSGRRAKRFEVFPVIRQMRHFIAIDAVFLKYVLSRVGVIAKVGKRRLGAARAATATRSRRSRKHDRITRGCCSAAERPGKWGKQFRRTELRWCSMW